MRRSSLNRCCLLFRRLRGPSPGGALSGTYPNPDIAPGTIGTTQLSAFPAVRIAQMNSAMVVPTGYVNGKAPDYDTVSYDNALQAGPPIVSSNFLRVPMAGTYLVVGTFSWEASASGARRLTMGSTPCSPNCEFVIEQVV